MSDDGNTLEVIEGGLSEPPCESVGMPHEDRMLEAARKQSKRSKILDCAGDLIQGDRHKQHGDATYAFDSIARAWTWLLEGKLAEPILPYEVALMCDLMKTSRIKTGEHSLDNYIDKAGYTALAGELHK